jgi:hypothetical protein
MALTSYFKADNTSLLNNVVSWSATPVPGPPPSSPNSQAVWDSRILSARTAQPGASTTWGKILVTNPAGLCTIQAQTGALITLTPTDPEAAGVGIELTSAGTQNFLITNNVALGSSQEWKVAAGRLLDVRSVISGATSSLIKTDAGTLNLGTGVSTFGSGGGQSFTARGGLTIVGSNNSLGAAANTVVVESGAAIQISTATPAQTVFNVSGPGLSGISYGAISSDTSGWANTKTITAQSDNTVIGFRGGGAFQMRLAVAAGVTAITLNGENAALSDNSGYTMTGGASTYNATVTLVSFAYNGTLPVGIKYSIGSAANVTDAPSSGGAGLGNLGNTIIVSASGGLMSASASGTFNRNYTFVGRALNNGQPNIYSHFKCSNTGNSTTTFAGRLTFQGTSSDWVQFTGTNLRTSIYRFVSGCIIEGQTKFVVGSAAFAVTSDCTAQFDSGVDLTGFYGPLYVANINYGTAFPNENAVVYVDGNQTYIDNTSGGALTVRHSSYTNDNADFLFVGTNPLILSGPAAGPAAEWSGSINAAAGWTNSSANLLTLDFNFGASATAGAFIKNGTGPLALKGNNTAFTVLTHNAGSLYLNSAGSAGPPAATMGMGAATLDNTSGVDIDLIAAGQFNLVGAGFTWGGTGNLYRASGVSYGTSRTITFTTSGTKTLKFASWLASGSPQLNVGGGATGTTSRLHIVGANGSTATASSVTAGYLKVGNASGLGAVGSTTAWTVTTGACIELDGVTIPSSKNGSSLTGDGPTGTSHGVLRSTSTTAPSEWRGSLVFNSTAGGRITAAPQTTLTLSDATYLVIEGPLASSCPAFFDANLDATLNVNRRFAATIGAVTCGQANGTGRVVLSRANQHTGKLTCAAGTTALTNTNAAGPAATGAGVDVNAGATLAVEVASTYKAVFPGTTKLGSSFGSPAAKAIFRIGA